MKPIPAPLNAPPIAVKIPFPASTPFCNSEIIPVIIKEIPIPTIAPAIPPANFPILKPIPAPSTAPPIAVKRAFPKFTPSLISAIIPMIERTTPTPMIAPRAAPCTKLPPVFNAMPAPTPAPAIAPLIAPSRILPKSSPSTISATMDMIASESPTPITAPTNIPWLQVSPKCFASIKPSPAPESAPPAIPSKMFPHVSSLLMIMSLILSMRSVKPTASISPPKRLSSLPRSGISESAMAQAANPAPISAMRGRIFSIHF